MLLPVCLKLEQHDSQENTFGHQHIYNIKELVGINHGSDLIFEGHSEQIWSLNWLSSAIERKVELQSIFAVKFIY